MPAILRIPVMFLATALLAAPLAGCLQVETRIKINTDGSATVTERLQFSQRLLDLSSSADKEHLSKLLGKEAALDRMKHMGKGIELVSHEVRDGTLGSRESVVVFRIEDINELIYASPFLAFGNYPERNLVKVQMVPLYKSRSYAGSAGEMALKFAPMKSREEGKPVPPDDAPTPRARQVYRQIRPILADLLRGIELRFTFESYAGIHTGFGTRDARAGTNEIDMLNFTDADLDQYSTPLMENEEIMLDVARGELGSQDIAAMVAGWTGNKTLPVFHPWGSKHAPWKQSDEILFRPSRELFDKYFKGKKLDYARWQPSPPEKHVEATFEKIGWQPARKTNGGN